jgi:hypothetical protein
MVFAPGRDHAFVPNTDNLRSAAILRAAGASIELPTNGLPSRTETGSGAPSFLNSINFRSAVSCPTSMGSEVSRGIHL